MAVSRDVKQQLATTGAAVSPVWGGPQKQRYYTPAGDEVWGVPSLRDWAQKDKDGKIVAQGTRDANLDKGWALTPPAALKLHCAGCDRWHDTDDQVAACVGHKVAAAEAWEVKARKMHAKNGGGEVEGDTADRLDKLEAGVDEIKAMLKQALGG